MRGVAEKRWHHHGGADLTYPGSVGALAVSASWNRFQPRFQLPGSLGFLVGCSDNRLSDADLVSLFAGGRRWPVMLWRRAVLLTSGDVVGAPALSGLRWVVITPDPARIHAHRH
jgi:hypothetical protein